MRVLSILLLVLALVPFISNAVPNAGAGAAASIWSDTKLLVSSIGRLGLNKLFVSAPAIEFVAGSTQWNAAGVSIKSRSGAYTGPARDDNPGPVSGISNGADGGTIFIAGSDVGLTDIDWPRVDQDGDAWIGGDLVLSSPFLENVMNGAGALVLPKEAAPAGGGATRTVISPVPEPGTYSSMLAGLLVLAGFIRAKQRRGT